MIKNKKSYLIKKNKKMNWHILLCNRQKIQKIKKI